MPDGLNDGQAPLCLPVVAGHPGLREGRRDGGDITGGGRRTVPYRGIARERLGKRPWRWHGDRGRRRVGDCHLLLIGRTAKTPLRGF